MYLTSGKINRKSDSRTVRLKKNVQEVADLLRQVPGELGTNVDKIEDDPFGKFGSSEDLAVVLSGEERGLSRDIWAVHAYVTATSDGCDVELIALGEGLSVGYSGIYYCGRIKMIHKYVLNLTAPLGESSEQTVTVIDDSNIEVAGASLRRTN